MKKMFVTGLTTLIVLSGLGLMSFTSERVNAQYIPAAYLTFVESIKSVDVSLGSNNTVVFNGTLHVECYYSTSTEFSITKSSDIENWTVAVSPSSIGLPEGAQTANVTVIVKALPETNSNVSGVITISGSTRTTTPGVATSNDFSSQVTVIVKKYYILSISSCEQYKETLPDSEITIDFEVQNMGNTGETFDFAIVNYNELNEIGIYTWFKTSKLRVEGHDTENNSLGVYVSNNTSMGVYNITINVFSENVFCNMSFFIRVISMIQFSSPLTNPTIDEGNSQTFAIITTELDDNITIEWYLDDVLVETGTKYIFEANYTSSGVYIVTAIARRENLSEEKSWVLTVNNIEKENKGFLLSIDVVLLLLMFALILVICVLLLRRRKYKGY